ncbi:MAG: hypothetical protein ACREAW_01060 [Nitrososphaera sp.]
MPSSWVIIAGTIGIASVLIGLLYFQPQLFDIAAKEPYTRVTIEGLKDMYKVGEPIDFTVRVEGYGCDRGFPSVAIYKASAEEPVWSRLGEFRLFPAGYSCPHADIHNVRHIGDLEKYNNDEQERLRIEGGMPIVMKDEGRYVVDVESVVKGFTVIS